MRKVMRRMKESEMTVVRKFGCRKWHFHEVPPAGHDGVQRWTACGLDLYPEEYEEVPRRSVLSENFCRLCFQRHIREDKEENYGSLSS